MSLNSSCPCPNGQTRWRSARVARSVGALSRREARESRVAQGERERPTRAPAPAAALLEAPRQAGNRAVAAALQRTIVDRDDEPYTDPRTLLRALMPLLRDR